MYYQFLVVHLDAPFLLLSAVTTGLIIRIFYQQYMKIQIAMRVFISMILFTVNAIILVPAIVFLYRWIMICGFYNSENFLDFSNNCSKYLIL
jgi:uncharacterized protein HemY